MDDSKETGVLDETRLPQWLRDALAAERALFPDSGLPQALGSPGYRVHDIGDGWWVWDNGTGGCLVSDGGPGSRSPVRWINWDDVGDHRHPDFSPAERLRIVAKVRLHWGW